MSDIFLRDFLRSLATSCSSMRNIVFPYAHSIDLYAIERSIPGVPDSMRTWLGLIWKYGEKNTIYPDNISNTAPICQRIFWFLNTDFSLFLCVNICVYGARFFFCFEKKPCRDEVYFCESSSRKRYFFFFSSITVFRKESLFLFFRCLRIFFRKSILFIQRVYEWEYINWGFCVFFYTESNLRWASESKLFSHALLYLVCELCQKTSKIWGLFTRCDIYICIFFVLW